VIRDRIKGMIDINWLNNLHELQPDNVKIPYNYDYIKESILKHGFAFPFAVWVNKGKVYSIDGHTRKQILIELKASGEYIPDKLKGFEIDAKTKKEAQEILIDVYNMKHNPFDSEVLMEWIEAEQLDVSMVSINVKIEEVSELAPRNIIGNNYEAERNIDNSDYLIVNLSATHIKKLELIRKKLDADDNKEAILKLIELYDN